MSYRFEENRNGKIYVFEISSYWDKEKQQSRQRRTYLGRKNEITGQVVKKANQHIPLGSRDVGSVHFLIEISKSLKLIKILKKVFPEEYAYILYLSFFKFIMNEPYYLYPLWYESSYVPEKNRLCSQSISKLFLKIGKDQKSIENFFLNWIREHSSTSKAVMFDVTSISSYGFGNDFLEKGYNRDGEELNQTNFGLLSQDLRIDPKSKSASLPVCYRIYPGSITDVTTLHNVLLLAKEYKLNLKCLVLDKGFYSQKNIKSLHSQGFSYIIPLSFSTSLSKQLIDSSFKELSSARSSFIFDDDVYWYCKKDITIGDIECTSHMYLDKMKKSRKEYLFLSKISALEKLFFQKKICSKSECDEYVNETLNSWKHFFLIKESDGGFSLERHVENIEKEINSMGVIILLTRKGTDLLRDDILNFYRSKDSIEKIFSNLKNDLNEKRNRTHSLMTMRGSMFINFISLILISWIDHIMKEKKLHKKITKAEVYKILNQLKFYELATGQLVLGECSSKQKSLFSAFKVKKNISPTFQI